MTLDDQRFLGDVLFRQNQQTFDGVMVQLSPRPGHRLRYQYMNRAHRPVGDDNPLGEFDMRTHLANYRVQTLRGDTLSLFGMWLEMRTRELLGRSHKVFGARYDAERELAGRPLRITAAYARQSDFKRGLASNDANYAALSSRFTLPNAWVLGAAFEHLGGNGTYALQTPLATLHKFQGAADLFVAGTPAVGVNDWQASLRVPLAGGTLEVRQHWFDAVDGGAALGREVNLSYVVDFARRWQIGVQYADYRARAFGVDTRRAWAWLGYRFR